MFLFVFPILIFGLPSVAAENPSAAIIKATMSYLQKESPGVVATVKVDKVDGDYARVVVAAKNTDTALAFLKRKGNEWTVLTLGTGFAPEDYKQLGIPASLQK